jgi:transposase
MACVAVGIEASGGYERGVTRALLAAGDPGTLDQPVQAAAARQSERGSRQERSAQAAKLGQEQ